MLVSPELADVLSAIISRLRGPAGTVPLTVSYDVRERVWNPPMPLLFQRGIGSENRAFTPTAFRKLLISALAATGLTDATGAPLMFSPHDFHRIFVTDAKMSSVASHAAFPGSSESPLPAVQRVALERAQGDDRPRTMRELGCQQPTAPGATLMHLAPLPWMTA